jgi:hypothetical protein
MASKTSPHEAHIRTHTQTTQQQQQQNLPHKYKKNMNKGSKCSSVIDMILGNKRVKVVATVGTCTGSLTP